MNLDQLRRDCRAAIMAAGTWRTLNRPMARYHLARARLIRKAILDRLELYEHLALASHLEVRYVA